MWARLGSPGVRIILIIGIVLLALSLGLFLYEGLIFERILPPPALQFPEVQILFAIPVVVLGVLVLLVGISLWLRGRGSLALFIAFLLVEAAGIVLTLMANLYPIVFVPVYAAGAIYILQVFVLAGETCTAVGTFLLLLLALRAPTAPPPAAPATTSGGLPPPLL